MSKLNESDLLPVLRELVAVMSRIDQKLDRFGTELQHSDIARRDAELMRRLRADAERMKR